MTTPNCQSLREPSGRLRPLRCDRRALDQRLEFRPDDALVNLVIAGETRKAAIGTGNDTLAPERADPVAEPLRDQFRMLDHHVRLRDHARDHDAVVGQFGVAPARLFVFVPRIGSFKGERTGLETAEDVEDVLCLDVMYARAEIDSVTGVETHAVLGDAAQRMVD